jgi:nitric oxide reductase NorD protein
MRRRVPEHRRLVLKAKRAAERVNEHLRDRLNGERTLTLEQVQRRLDLLITAIYGRSIPIQPIDQSVWNRERVRQLAARDPRAREPTPGGDGATIYLPPELATTGGDDAAMARYRVFAVEQAERIARGTAAHAPLDDPLARDLYLLREGTVIDAHIASAHPGLLAALGVERAAALAHRPKLETLSPAEREVEQRLRDALTGAPEATPPATGAAASDPEASRAWAEAVAREIRATGAPYRGVPPSSVWGSVRTASASIAASEDVGRPWLGTEQGELPEDDGRDGESSPEHEGEQAGPTPESNERAERVDDGVGLTKAADAGTLELLPPPTFYDEWNASAGAYVTHGAAVREYAPAEGDLAWARDTLRDHGALVRQVRQQFERLRARRTLLTRQRAGDDLDIAACVDAIVDRRIGAAPDDRLYVDARPARRGLAISLLADVSGSTEARVNEHWRIIDLEKLALLLATQALDALGDLYAVQTFGGKTAQNVKITTVKDFAERSGETVQRRIAAIQPGGFTRLGAAVRQATHRLARQSAGHRLLLLLSDGRPNDVDLYQGPYGVEDARQAILEARASGVYPFCLTIDRDASQYLPRIFGQAGHTILQRPEQLPRALLRVVQALIGKP